MTKHAAQKDTQVKQDTADEVARPSGRYRTRYGVAVRLYGAFGAVVVIAAVALVLARQVIERVRVGGERYQGIQLKRDVIDEVANLKGGFAQLSARVALHMTGGEGAQAQDVDKTFTRLDGIFESLSKSRLQHKMVDSVTCVTCHVPSEIEIVFSPLGEASAHWSKARGKLAAVMGSTNRDVTKLGASFREALGELEELTGHVDEVLALLHDASRRQVAAIESEARSVEATALIVGTLFILLIIIGAYVITKLIVRPLARTSAAAREIAQEIVAAAQEQSASTSETSSAISETTTTAEEIRQTSDMAAQKARAVTEITGRAQAAADQSMQAIADSLEAMRRIRQEVESIARNILELSERAIQIGEIVQTVNGVAEQSNLLAVNASIEAAKAGEHGKGFSVVASEVKALASQSKEATEQIRSMLSEIQKSSNSAVMVTENGVKRVDEGMRLIEAVAKRFDELGTVIQESADSADQISGAANQQLSGVGQITDAMRNVEQAARENAQGAQNLEKVAERVRQMSHTLDALVGGDASEA